MNRISIKELCNDTETIVEESAEKESAKERPEVDANTTLPSIDEKIFSLSNHVNKNEVMIVSQERILLKNYDTGSSICYIKNGEDKWEIAEVDIDNVLLEFGLKKRKRARPSLNKNIIENFKKNFDELWKSHVNTMLEIELKREVVWNQNEKIRESIIFRYIDDIHNDNSGGMVNYHILYKNVKSLEICKDLFKEHCYMNDNDVQKEKYSRKAIQQYIRKRVNNSFADKLCLRFNRFCDISPFCGDAWWSICSIPLSHWAVPSIEEWNDILNHIKGDC